MSTNILSPTVNVGPPEGSPPNYIITGTFPFCLDLVVRVIVDNPVGGVIQQCDAFLQLSADNGITWQTMGTKSAEAGGDAVSFIVFKVADFSEFAQWNLCRLRIGGNIAGNCTVSAVADGVCVAMGGGGFNAPAFTAFGISGQSTPIEVGATIAAGSKTFTWSTSNSINVAPNSISIVDTTASTVLAAGLANTGSDAITIAAISNILPAIQTWTKRCITAHWFECSDAITIAAITNILPATQTWTISALDTQAGAFSDTFSVAWDWRVYAGDSVNATLTANQIKALTPNSALQAGFAGTYTINQTTDYAYFCYPDSMGSVASFIDTATGLPMDMATSSDNAAYSNTANGWSYALVSVTNANGIATNYRVYRSTYTFTATLVMRVS